MWALFWVGVMSVVGVGTYGKCNVNKHLVVNEVLPPGTMYIQHV